MIDPFESEKWRCSREEMSWRQRGILCVISSIRLKVFTSCIVNLYVWASRKKILSEIKSTELSCSIRAHRYEISVDPSSTLKNYSQSGRRLSDKPYIFLKSFDNSEQNQHRCILNFFFKIFWVGSLFNQNRFSTGFRYKFFLIAYFWRSQYNILF